MSTINKSIKITALLLFSFAVCQSALAVKPDDKPDKPPHPHDPPAPPTDPADPHPEVNIWLVAPVGNDSNNGEDAPFATIQKAVDEAGPGDTIRLAAGDYFQDVRTVLDGTADARIFIIGPRAYPEGGDGEAVIRGGGNDRIFEINNSNHTIAGFTINGFHHLIAGEPGEPEELPDDELDDASYYSDKLVFVFGIEKRSGPTRVEILDMHFKNAGGECLRFRYFVQDSVVANSTFSNCGVYDFQFGDGGKNGEAIYIGTSSTAWKDGKNPTADPDESNDNHIHHNTITFGDINGDGIIDSFGGECIDIKEGSEDNLVEENECIGASDIESGAINVRGDRNIIYNNNIHDNAGAGVRLGGHKVKKRIYGVENDVFRNTIEYNVIGGIKFMVTPQRTVCGNIMNGNVGGDAVGDYSSDYPPPTLTTTTDCPADPPEE